MTELRGGVMMSPEDAIKYDEFNQQAEYYDRLQYVYKIKLNSLYGALSNLYFRLYNLNCGESTTGTGRMILKHQCRKVNEILEGKYDIDIPMYQTTDDAIDRGHSPNVALHGPLFKGKFQSESVIYGDSVAGDTLIDTLSGRVPIESLFTSVDYTTDGKEYCDLSNSSVVALTFDKKTKQTCYRYVNYVMRHKTAKQMYRVWISGCQYIDVTEDHSFMGYITKESINYWDHNINDIFVEVSPMNVGKRGIKSLVYPRRKPHYAITDQGFSPELYAFIGLILGGSIENDLIILPEVSSFASEIETKLLNPLIEDKWISSWQMSKDGTDIEISSSGLLELVKEHMWINNKMKIPVWMEHESLENIASFAGGVFSMHGIISGNSSIKLNTKYDVNLPTLIEMLFKLGISCTYTKLPDYRIPFQLKFNNIQSVIEQITLYNPVLVNQLQRFKFPHYRKMLDLNDFELLRPGKISPLPIEERWVYDIEVDGTHMFYANNILVHNTDSTYFKTWTDNTEDAIKIADAVSDQVNKSYKQFMQNQFLCQPGFDDLVKAGREVVSDRGIFVEKKRYILHLVDVEGKKVDKCKVMGLDTKKTTLPAHISKNLNSFIERYLKGESWEDISVSIVKYKNNLESTTELMEIGLPKGIKNVEEYTANYNRDPKTRLPGHVAAAIHYNSMLDHYNDKSSIPIISGMKIKVFYLKTKSGRFKSIALPTDSESVPEWFTANFTVDKNLHITKLIDNPLQNILKSINKKSPTNQSVTVDAEWVF